MQCDHSLENPGTVFSGDAICFLIRFNTNKHCGSNVLVCGSN